MTKTKRKKPTGPFICYALQNKKCGKVYTGQTNNWTRRIRQHNGEIKGGARYTTRSGKGKGCWSALFHVLGFTTHRSVLQFEYSMKKRGPRVRGPSGRIRKLEYVLQNCKYPNGLKVNCFIAKEQYLKFAKMTLEQFDAKRNSQCVEFTFTKRGLLPVKKR